MLRIWTPVTCLNRKFYTLYNEETNVFLKGGYYNGRKER